MQRGMIMHQSDIERFAFLFLCGKRDRAILMGIEKMTFSDLDRLTYVTDFLGLKLYNLEQELIQAIFFDGLSEREVGARLGITQSVVNKRKARILIKLRKIIEN